MSSVETQLILEKETTHDYMKVPFHCQTGRETST